LSAIENTLEIDSDNQVKSFSAHLTDHLAILEFDKLRIPGNAGIVDQNINMAKLSYNVIDPRLNCLPIGDVHFIEANCSPGFFNERVSCLFIDITDNDLCAFLDEL